MDNKRNILVDSHHNAIFSFLFFISFFLITNDWSLKRNDYLPSSQEILQLSLLVLPNRNSVLLSLRSATLRHQRFLLRDETVSRFSKAMAKLSGIKVWYLRTSSACQGFSIPNKPINGVSVRTSVAGFPSS